MGLMGPAFTTNSLKTRKVKLRTNTPEFQQQFRDHNDQMRRARMPIKTLEEYCNYRLGKSSKRRLKAVKSPLEATSLWRESPQVPSEDGYLKLSKQEVEQCLGQRQENEYTGANLIGIAVMHKSNLVPVFRKDDAVEISRMRRG
jgi:hypothetical protein